jgi:TorA maturation chaperone TorD
MDEQNEWAEAASLRQGLYRFFAGAFLPPDERRLQELELSAAYLDTYGVNRFAFAPWWFGLLDAFDDMPGAELLHSEYVRLFLTSSDGTLCPPVESYYRASAEGGGLAELLSDLERNYRRLGVKVQPDSVESVDHISVQLETMAELCRREAEGASNWESETVHKALHDQYEFISQHPAAWFPRLAERVAGADPMRFYARLTEATDAYLKHEYDFIPGLAHGVSSRDRM